jgi:hypothetical protein
VRGILAIPTGSVPAHAMNCGQAVIRSRQYCSGRPIVSARVDPNAYGASVSASTLMRRSTARSSGTARRISKEASAAPVTMRRMVPDRQPERHSATAGNAH